MVGKLQFKDIYIPIVDELQMVETELKEKCESINTLNIKDIVNYFFNIPGKRLRPTLALLSAGIINSKDNDSISKSQLIKFATGLELMHSACLIHDDVIDDDLFRRGQGTINNLYGKKIAVLVGDVVYALAFSTLSNSLPKSYTKIIVELTEHMCDAEVLQSRNTLPDRNIYLDIIKGKTALFMSLSCKISAILAGGTVEQIKYMEEYGLNLGMAYQIIDDCMDNDINSELDITVQDAESYGKKAIISLETFDDSPYKSSLVNLVHFIIQLSHEK